MTEDPAPTEAETNDLTQVFLETYDWAKNNYNWTRVAAAIAEHPDWLIRIPHGRRWTMLHQIVFSGNIEHLNEVLSSQLNNEEFSLCFKALDHKTVRDVATERAHIYPQMMNRIEKLVALDSVLYNAKQERWDLVKQSLRQQPRLVNEKLPYQKWYLGHYLASIGRLDIFQELAEFCPFRFHLLVDEKTISQIARENNFPEFADYADELTNHPLVLPDADPPAPASDDEDNAATGLATPFNPHFDDDPGMMLFSILPNGFTGMLLHHGGPFDPQPPPAAAATTTASETEAKPKPALTAEEQEAYEKTVKENLQKFPSDELLMAVTCSITKNILVDPGTPIAISDREGGWRICLVVAADGFTYEREAILKWFEQSKRSPMTNQELPNLDLKPNHAIKSILQSLVGMQKSEDPKSEEPKSDASS